MTESNTTGLLMDTHVHLRSCFDAARFFDVAWGNFRKWAQREGVAVPWVPVLMLTESATEDGFRRVHDLSGAVGDPQELAGWGNWFGERTEEEDTVWISKNGKCLLLIAGRQVDTGERLEVSVLGSDRFIPDHTPIEEVLEKAAEYDAVPVIPWAPGKWFFDRGRQVGALMDRRQPGGFYLGDNGGRPWSWPTPALLKRAHRDGIPVLPGSDPLPFPEEMNRTGTFGVTARIELDRSRPGASIKRLLRDGASTLRPYGRLAGTFSFLRKEVTMQLTKKKRKGMKPVEQGDRS